MSNATVTGGQLTVTGSAGGPHFELIGSGFNIKNNGADQGNVAAQSHGPYKPGDAIDLHGKFAGELGLGSGPCKIGRLSYTKLFFTGTIEFKGSAQVPGSKLATASVMGKFTFSGNLKGYTQNPFVGNPGPAVFDYQLSGHGTATVELKGFSAGPPGYLYQFTTITYKFEP